jgi:hypothetical protein
MGKKPYPLFFSERRKYILDADLMIHNDIWIRLTYTQKLRSIRPHSRKSSGHYLSRLAGSTCFATSLVHDWHVRQGQDDPETSVSCWLAKESTRLKLHDTSDGFSIHLDRFKDPADHRLHKFIKQLKLNFFLSLIKIF